MLDKPRIAAELMRLALHYAGVAENLQHASRLLHDQYEEQDAPRKRGRPRKEKSSGKALEPLATTTQPAPPGNN
jgi:hypothetical protein